MKKPKKLKGNFSSPSHARAPKQEGELAKRLSGKVTPGSGNGAVKGDVRVTGVARIEAKTTKAKSFSVTRLMVEKIQDAATAAGEVPAIVVEFNKKGKPECEVVVIPVWALEELINGQCDKKN